jgi:hypothetical protein
MVGASVEARLNVISFDQARMRLHSRSEHGARLAFIERDFEAALTMARRATASWPRCSQSQLLLGDVLCALGHEPQALLCYHRARRLVPENHRELAGRIADRALRVRVQVRPADAHGPYPDADVAGGERRRLPLHKAKLAGRNQLGDDHGIRNASSDARRRAAGSVTTIVR